MTRGKYVIAKQEVTLHNGRSLGLKWTVRRRWGYGLSRSCLCISHTWAHCVAYVNRALARTATLNAKYLSRRPL